MEQWWLEDNAYLDCTSFGLGLCGMQGAMDFRTKGAGVISGIGEVKRIMKALDLELASSVLEGAHLGAKELVMSVRGEAGALQKAWKVSQNMLESMSGVASFTHELVKRAKAINAGIEIATTRKHAPALKAPMIRAIMSGGAIPHRLGLYDSVLIFEQHRAFFTDQSSFEVAFLNLKRRFLEKKIAVEVASVDEAEYFAKLGADILQCERMDCAELLRCVELKRAFPALVISATGGVGIENVAEVTRSGVDLIVTSAPYYAKPFDIKVEMRRAE